VTTVEGIAVDGSGNTASCTFKVTVKPRSKVEILVGVLVGLGVPLLALLVGLHYLRRLCNRAWQPKDWNEIFEKMEQFASQSGGDKDAKGNGTGRAHNPLYPRELQRRNVTLLETLGQGAFGRVCKASYRENKVMASWLVAVKLLLSSDESAQQQQQPEGAKRELLEEAAVMAQFQHENVVRLVGVVTAGAPVMMVLEFMEYGSLKGMACWTSGAPRDCLTVEAVILALLLSSSYCCGPVMWPLV
jgi:hypothetical protein